ncbi:glycosyltransferase family 2 protein [Bradyrhizobium neotropicale]|uniref:glycosyltransferase family 2 protein n=1 Tax=Bradyrhizobium neotropicale TaxID=1497615 RepID=UPI001AD6B8E9|nr:glycosyltransferase family 2 protein [Bradyrhizobium neotropicale]MBO4221518.1 glycosyltransferase family 2 protein [Bradyrhizobium neotropicale]
MSTASIKLAVIIVSYCNADDVDRCLKSLARSDWDHFEIFICENGGEAAYGRLLATLVGQDRTLQRTSEASDGLDQPQKRLVSVTKCRFQARANVVRVGLATENLGYGGGVNAWLEPLLGVPDWSSALVLNPDTEVDSRSLSELIAKSAEGFGMVGGSLVFDNSPDKVINYGLHWSRVTGRVVAVGRNAPAGSAPSAEDLGRIDAVSGACVLVTRAFVEDVGLMAEDYFLYMEDLDWGRRRGKHRIGFASKAVVRHIGGTTIGSAVAPEKRSHLSIYLSARNSILYARRFAGWRWICHFGVGLLFAARYMLKGSLPAGRVAFFGLLDGAKGKTGRPDAVPGT